MTPVGGVDNLDQLTTALPAMPGQVVNGSSRQVVASSQRYSLSVCRIYGVATYYFSA